MLFGELITQYGQKQYIHVLQKHLECHQNFSDIKKSEILQWDSNAFSSLLLQWEKSNKKPKNEDEICVVAQEDPFYCKDDILTQFIKNAFVHKCNSHEKGDMIFMPWHKVVLLNINDASLSFVGEYEYIAAVLSAVSYMGRTAEMAKEATDKEIKELEERYLYSIRHPEESYSLEEVREQLHLPPKKEKTEYEKQNEKTRIAKITAGNTLALRITCGDITKEEKNYDDVSGIPEYIKRIAERRYTKDTAEKLISAYQYGYTGKRLFTIAEGIINEQQ